MLFNSIEFAVFLPIVFILYWFVFNKKISSQNSLLVLASYVFYGWWDWRFLFLIVFSSLIDFILGIQLSKTERKPIRKSLLLISVLVNIGFLGFFKYFNFFAESLFTCCPNFGLPLLATHGRLPLVGGAAVSCDRSKYSKSRLQMRSSS